MDRQSVHKDPASTAAALRRTKDASSPSRQFAGDTAKMVGLTQLQSAMDRSPTVQRLQTLQLVANGQPTLQRQDDDEMQMVQRVEDDEMQMMQRVEDDELQMVARDPAPQHTALQRVENGGGGLPGQLKSGIESLSGMSMDGVNVHRNSSKPASVQAHAYAQGSDIHLGPGQDKHLPHEAWHVVQQAQGRVKPTMQMAGVSINDDTGLEREADAMGAKALTTGESAVQREET